jgi:DNA-3-methyladenine glycosylase
VAPLPPSFYDRDALDVAFDLIGCELEAGGVRVRLTEVEAYRFPGDSANHARMGRTARNAPMWGPPGRAYVYLCYGLHSMLNVVTGPEGHAAAVLIRGAEPITGDALLASRRPGPRRPAWLDGPGKLCAGLLIGVERSGEPLDGAIRLLPRQRVPRIAVGPRIGIDYATVEDRLAPWRVADADSRWVGQRRSLRPRPNPDGTPGPDL